MSRMTETTAELPVPVAMAKKLAKAKAPGEPGELIVAAAIQIEGVTISLPRPARHGEVLFSCTFIAAESNWLHTATQGFLTSTGRFVNRVQARQIAYVAGQNPGHSAGDAPELYSEDLW